MFHLYSVCPKCLKATQVVTGFAPKKNEMIVCEQCMHTDILDISPAGKAEQYDPKDGGVTDTWKRQMRTWLHRADDETLDEYISSCCVVGKELWKAVAFTMALAEKVYRESRRG